MNRFKFDKVYIVAEIGQNHNGSMEFARALIDDAADAGCSAIKAIKRDISCELTEDAYNRVYDSPNSFAKIYGKHREFLEFSYEQHRTLKEYANNRNMDYFITVRDLPSLKFALTLDPPLLKIASIDITHIPLLKAIAKTNKPVAFSIGTATKKEIETAMAILAGNETILVVCTSQYPSYLDNIHLNRLKSYHMYKKGFSCHLPDPMLGIASVALGAEYVEYHISLDRDMKGTDQSVSLEVNEWHYMVTCIKDLTIALGSDKISEDTPKFLGGFKKKLMKRECEDGIWRIH